MKAMKAILSGKGLPRRGEKGFTLVELLIVLAILAVLAAVVIPNVTGMFGRGAEQAWETDLKTIQTASATFYFDIHVGPDAGVWGDTDGVAGHWYPVTAAIAADLYVDTSELDSRGNPRVNKGAGVDAVLADITAGSIWMGLLINAPAAGAAVGTADRQLAAPQTLEKGPYLNEIPESSKAGNAGNGNVAPGGTYYWVVGLNGVISGVYLCTDTGDTNYYAGFGGTYP